MKTVTNDKGHVVALCISGRKFTISKEMAKAIELEQKSMRSRVIEKRNMIEAIISESRSDVFEAKGENMKLNLKFDKSNQVNSKESGIELFGEYEGLSEPDMNLIKGFIDEYVSVFNIASQNHLKSFIEKVKSLSKE